MLNWNMHKGKRARPKYQSINAHDVKVYHFKLQEKNNDNNSSSNNSVIKVNIIFL